MEWEADTVLEVTPEAGEPFIVHIEWQSGNDQRMAFRMARYDLLLCDSYHRKVMGVVIYVGEKPMSMENSFHSFGLQYTCPMIDIRDMSPDVFLSSDDPGEVILAILAGREVKLTVIREILHKLRILTAGDVAFFSEKLKHLELIAQLRGLNLQEQLIKEEETMPITIDIRKDLRYQQGVAEGVLKAKKQDALKMLEKGISLSLIEEITGLSVNEIKILQNTLKA
ncbi:hypothetical protein HNQ91_001028 [Filimonas zeae]|uniref:hypothetical protein n=1 Tax=Filimonas zeae TaxID=1737353 RepID=UPI00166AA0E8|nr:hypothetical protein [Filimonas zeae]MDR6338006.1 hypothetical protein [Filimonas zeae]